MTTMLRAMLSSLLVICLVPFVAYAAEEPSTEELRQAMVDLVTAIEKAGGVSTDAADQVRFADDEVIEAFFSAVDKREIVERSQRIVQEIERSSARDSVKDMSATSRIGGGDGAIDSRDFTPDYPGWGEISFKTARAYGLVQYPSDRCSGDAFENWKESMFWYGYALDQAQPTCLVSGCDPSGVLCVIDCGVVATAMVVYNGLKLGVESCEKHDANVDGAEIEAAYENGRSGSSGISDLKRDLAAHDRNIDGDVRYQGERIYNNLATHRAVIESRLQQHDTDLKNRIDHLDSQLATVQQTLDQEVEIRSIDLQVVELIPREKFFISTTEGGIPVDAMLLGVKVSKLADDGMSVEFVEVPAHGSPVTGISGLLDVAVTLPDDLRQNAKMFQFRVKDQHVDSGGIPTYEHFGTAIYPTKGVIDEVVVSPRTSSRSKRAR